MRSRQRAQSAAVDLQVSRWHVQPALNLISSGPTVRHLEPQIMDLLMFLASTRGRVVSKDEIIEAVWEGRFISDATLTRSVSDLRRALGDDMRRPVYIETIPKRGYRLVADVADIGAQASTLAPVTQKIVRTPAPPSLVVLPFANLGGGDDQYFCDGLTEEIINVLTRLPGLRVISRTSAFAARTRGGDIGEIGRSLGVTHAIEGSVRRADASIRVTAQLIEIGGQSHLWSERYDRALADVFAIQDEIAEAIARRLTLTLDRLGRRVSAPTSSIEAYGRYLEGRHHFFQGTRDSLDRAKVCFADAIRLDPAFAVAHDALSEVYWYQGFYGMAFPKEAFTLAVWESLRALEIDDRLGDAHALLAMLRKELDFDWAEVDREYARALELDPQSPVVRLRYAICGLMPRGRAAEAAAEIERVVQTDPLSILIRWWLGTMYWFSGQSSRMREPVERMLDIDPRHPLTHMMRGTWRFAEGDLPGSIAAFQQSVDFSGRLPWLVGWLGLACGIAGERDRAGALLLELLERSKAGYVPPFSLAVIALGLGNVDRAFEWMDQAVDVRDPMVVPILNYPFLDPLRTDPRYQRLLMKMNLTESGVSR